MLTFAANLSWMFKEHDFLDRFAAAADAGFEWVEYLFPYDHDPDLLAEKLRRHSLKLALFNAPPGDMAAGDRGTACLGARRAEFSAGLARALDYAGITGSPRLHVMAGCGSGEAALDSYKDALTLACAQAAAHGIDILIEPLNRYDAPGYLLNDFDLARRLIEDLGLPNLKLQFDIYHRQIIHGDVVRGLRQLLPITGHMQIASVPARHEPTTGELDDRFILRTIDGLGYAGVIGCEYAAAAGTRQGLSWMYDLRP